MVDADTLAMLSSAFPDVGLSEFRGEHRVVVPADRLHDAMQFLRDDCKFDFLVDVTCVDYLYYRGAKDRFGLVYLLANTETNERLTVRAFVNDPAPTIASVVDLWEGANWLEREVWDLFGVRFAGHPDLRRIVMPDTSEAHPLRKDYPLQGRGERHNLPVLTRNEG